MQFRQQTTSSELSQSIFNNFDSNSQDILPSIALPKFKGDYIVTRGWNLSTFFNLPFTQICTFIAKYHYLETSLEGKAVKIIQSLEFTGDNF